MSFPIKGESFIIQPFGGTDTELAGILEVYRQCEDFLALGPVPVASMGMVLSDLALSKKEGGQFCIIYPPNGGDALGVIDFVPSAYKGDPALAYLSLFMIAAPWRGKGLGEAIVRTVEGEICRNGQVRAIESGVQVNNPGAIRFWQRMGYQIISGAEPQADGTIAYRLWKAV